MRAEGEGNVRCETVVAVYEREGQLAHHPLALNSVAGCVQCPPPLAFSRIDSNRIGFKADLEIV
jgi:hypothetical protein